MKQRYIIALGSNMWHLRHGAPRAVIAAALRELDGKGMKVKRASPIIDSSPLGPSLRRYANAAALVKTALNPPELLERLHHIERKFGRRRRGGPWRARVLDLDIVLWSGGAWASPKLMGGLIVPHTQFRQRAFVLGPAKAVAPGWRDPITGLTLRQLDARLTRPRPVP
ncbi:MAG: 2-amino-4-hydroxy-6-hydroxymethyldihydropteridine diphosphokinase [Novosphingobium sp.]